MKAAMPPIAPNTCNLLLNSCHKIDFFADCQLKRENSCAIMKRFAKEYERKGAGTT